MAPPADGEQGGVLPVQRPVSMIGMGLPRCCASRPLPASGIIKLLQHRSKVSALLLSAGTSLHHCLATSCIAGQPLPVIISKRRGWIASKESTAWSC